MYYHNRKAWKQYKSFPTATACPFCDPKERHERIILENQHAYVIDNRVHYSQWELRAVTDHLMVIPKKHVGSLAELDAAEQAGVIALIARYESQSYDVFARSPRSLSRSVHHQHTHLIKTADTPARGLLFLRRPRVMRLFR